MDKDEMLEFLDMVIERMLYNNITKIEIDNKDAGVCILVEKTR